jgi:hypothetical protein
LAGRDQLDDAIDGGLFPGRPETARTTVKPGCAGGGHSHEPPIRHLAEVGVLQLLVLDHSEVVARVDREGSDNVRGLGHGDER